MREEIRMIIEAYAKDGVEAVPAKGGGFNVSCGEDSGFVTLIEARCRSGINMARKRKSRQVRQGAWGDYAWVAMLNQPSK